LIQAEGGGFLGAQIWGGAVTLAGSGFVLAAWWFSVRQERRDAGLPAMKMALPGRKRPDDQGSVVGVIQGA